MLFVISVWTTIRWSRTMAGTMPPAWARMPGQTWVAAGTSFTAAWGVMMAAMMLPTLAPALGRYCRAVRGAAGWRLGALTTLVAAGYFAVWTAVGAALFPAGAALTTAALRTPALGRAFPFAAALALVLGGLVQLTTWKARRLACCRGASGRRPPRRPLAGSAWRYGLRLGQECVVCCVGLIAVLLAAGMMNLVVDGLVAAAITAERLAPSPKPAMRTTGVLAVAAGVVALGRAMAGGP